MRIENVRVRQVAMPRVDPTWRTASYAASAVDACILEIDAAGASGVGGLAAGRPGRGTPANELTAQIQGPVHKLLMGADALERRDLLDTLHEAGVHRSVSRPWTWPCTTCSARSTGLPFYALWGGAARRSIPIVRMVGIKSPADWSPPTGDFDGRGLLATSR